MKNRYLLSLAVISSMVLVNYSYAQDEAASDVEEVVTTGSRIARPETATSAPVTVVDAGDIKASGLTDLGEVLRRIAATQGSVPDLSTNNGGSGGVRYSLRGIGTSRTLILLNGRKKDLAIASIIGSYITSAIWFTSSTSFANPAVSIARSLTDTFTGIHFSNVPMFIIAQFISIGLVLIVFKKIFK